jgi:AcrR family transcriptional regulator
MVEEPVRRRRHGRELEVALLNAAWDELTQVGYAHLTMGSIAARAGTSEPVLYRRWANKDRLVLAAMEHHRASHPIATPDTGSLRGDVLAELAAAAQTMAGFYAVAVATSAGGLLSDTGLTPPQIRERILGAQSLPRVRPAYQRAHDRGEIDLDRIPASVLALPYDLVRHDLVLNLSAPTTERITAIVEELFLPLIALHSR